MPNHIRPTILFSSFYERHLVADGLARLRALGEVREVNRGRNLTRQELLEFLPGAHVCVAADEKYDADVLDHANQLALIAREGTGYDGVDIDEATKRGILVTNAPAVHNATANLAIGLMIALVRKIILCDRGVREGQWTHRNLWGCPDLTGMTLGISGFGLTGRAVAIRAIAMGMRVLVHNRSDVTESAQAIGARVASLDDLLALSDIVTVHIRHSPQTERLFDAAMFAKMKRGAYFLNVARGGIVNELALVDALNRGHLAGAAIDVMSQEPPEPNHPLLALDNLICTPHIAGETSTTVRDAFDLAVDQVCDCFEGRRPQHLVNPDAWERGKIHDLLR